MNQDFWYIVGKIKEKPIRSFICDLNLCSWEQFRCICNKYCNLRNSNPTFYPFCCISGSLYVRFPVTGDDSVVQTVTVAISQAGRGLLGCRVRVDLETCHWAPFLVASRTLQVLWGSQSRWDTPSVLQLMNTPGLSWRVSLAHAGQESSGHGWTSWHSPPQSPTSPSYTNGKTKLRKGMWLAQGPLLTLTLTPGICTPCEVLRL